ncbi:YolD-like family protein [Terribacillus saccharophilus]|uniref:YolD-like family protein n=1 Tax=Terribacillus saccharophilus TaxID=361277 RepID=UPI0039823775
MVNDRGKIKWTSLMLPEHVDMLQRMGKQIGIAQPPILDEQQQEELEQKMQTIQIGKTKISITHKTGMHVRTAVGVVTGLKQFEQFLLLDTKDTLYPVRISFSNILDMTIH